MSLHKGRLPFKKEKGEGRERTKQKQKNTKEISPSKKKGLIRSSKDAFLIAFPDLPPTSTSLPPPPQKSEAEPSPTAILSRLKKSGGFNKAHRKQQQVQQPVAPSPTRIHLNVATGTSLELETTESWERVINQSTTQGEGQGEQRSKKDDSRGARRGHRRGNQSGPAAGRRRTEEEEDGREGRDKGGETRRRMEQRESGGREGEGEGEEETNKEEAKRTIWKLKQTMNHKQNNQQQQEKQSAESEAKQILTRASRRMRMKNERNTHTVTLHIRHFRSLIVGEFN